MAEIVESGRDPQAARQALLRRLRRLLLPTLIVAAIVAGAVGSAWLSWRTTAEGARGVARAYVEAVDLRVRERVAGYFSPAEKAAEVIAASLRSADLGRWGPRQFDRVSRSYLRAYPQLLNIYVGAEDGSFMMTTRGEAGGYTRKLVRFEEGVRRVAVERLGPNGEVLESSETPDDPYDPRTRPWYSAALASDRPYWTPIYRFFTADSLGFTVAQKVEGEVAGVVGVDLLLRDLESFLDGLPLGDGGVAFVIDGDGRFVAPPPVGRRPDEAAPAGIEDVESPELKAVYDRFRIEKDFRGQFEVMGEWRLVSFSSLELSLGRDWWLIFSIPETALVGFVERAMRWSLLASVIVAVLSAALLAVVGIQARQAERRMARLDLDNARLRDAEDAYAELARVAVGAEPLRALRAATEIAARATGARRVGIWRLEAAGERLVCLDRFDAGAGGHAAGDQIEARRCPAAFERMERAQPFALFAAEAETDAAAGEIAAHYLEEAGAEALIAAPVAAAGRLAGWVWIEDSGERSEPTVDASAFAEAMAGLVAAQLPRARAEAGGAAEAEAEGGRLPEGVAEGGLAPLADRRRAARSRAFAERGLAADAGGGVLDGVAVAVVEFHDGPALAAPVGPGGATILDRAVAVACGPEGGEPPVAYARLEGRRLILADDGEGDPARAAERVAGLALDLQEAVLAASRALGRRAGRRRLLSIGLDLGEAFAARVGPDGAFNLWGGAVDLAASLAASGEERVLATESAARAARAAFASQRRGGFYAAGIGEIDVHLVQARR